MPEGFKKQEEEDVTPEGEDGFDEGQRRIGGQLMVRSRIEMIRKKIGPLPRKGKASGEVIASDESDETAEERRLLQLLSSSLKPPRIPPDLLKKEGFPENEGITMLNSIMDDPEGWEEDWKE